MALQRVTARNHFRLLLLICLTLFSLLCLLQIGVSALADTGNPAIPPFLGPAQLEKSWIAFEEEGAIPYIRLTVPKNITYKISYMTGPDRMVIDFSGVRLTGGGQTVTVESETVDRIRTAQFDPSTVRLVADLKKTVQFNVEREPDGEHISISLAKTLIEVGAGSDDGKLAPPLGACGVLKVKASSQIRYDYSYLRFPERFVLDLPATKAPPKWPSITPVGPISGIRFGKSPTDGVRIVLDLAAQLNAVVLPGSDEREVLVYLYPQIKSVSYGEESGQPWVNVSLTYPSPRLSTEIMVPIKARNGLVSGTVGLNGVICEKPPSMQGKPLSKLVSAIRFEQSGTKTVLKFESTCSFTMRADISSDNTQVKVTLSGSLLSGRRIVLDPGHGGGDPGAIGPNGVMEKDVVLDIALKLAGILRAEGVTVFLTRDKDVFIPLTDRAAYAASDNPEVFVSIHVNSAATSKASGTETWYSKTSDPKSGVLAQLVQTSATAASKLTDRGLRISDLLAVTKNRSIPAVLHEVGFISNPAEESLLNSDSFQELIAKALRDGLEQYFKGVY